MKKHLSKLALFALALPMLAACGNQTFFDTTYTFNYAIVQLPDGTVKKGAVKEWTNFSDGDMVQIKFEDGNTILAHSANAVLSVQVIE